jgi:alcohol dehydrogenase
MQLGAALAGMAIEASMLGAAHAAANPLTAQFGVTHGQAVGVMLPHIIRFNGQHCDAWYAELLRDIQPELGPLPPGEASLRLADVVTGWVKQAGLHTKIEPLGIASANIVDLAIDAMKQWTGTFNPISVTQLDFEKFYEYAL